MGRLYRVFHFSRCFGNHVVVDLFPSGHRIFRMKPVVTYPTRSMISICWALLLMNVTGTIFAVHLISLDVVISVTKLQMGDKSPARTSNELCSHMHNSSFGASRRGESAHCVGPKSSRKAYESLRHPMHHNLRSSHRLYSDSLNLTPTTSYHITS